MEVLRGPSLALCPFSFWLVQDGGEQGGSWAGGWRCGEGRIVDLHLAVGGGGLRTPEEAGPGRGCKNRRAQPHGEQ